LVIDTAAAGEGRSSAAPRLSRPRRAIMLMPPPRYACHAAIYAALLMTYAIDGQMAMLRR